MTEEHKLARIQAIRAALNSKNIAYLCKGLVVKQSHNYLGSHIEKMVYKNGDIIIYDKDEKEIERQNGKKAESKPELKKVKGAPKLPDSTDEKSS